MNKQTFKKLALSAVIAGAIATSGNLALAATQGTVGATSTGTLGITAPIPNRLKISFLDDLDFTTPLASWDGASDVSLSDDLCVWSNITGGYRVTVTGSGTGDAFTLAGTADTLSYTVQWNDVASTDLGAASVTSGTALLSQSGGSNGATCAGGGSLTARVIVTLPAASIDAATGSDTYTGTLTMVVAAP